MPRTPRLTDALRGRGKTLAFVGAVAALAGAGSASAATMASAAPAAAAAGHHAPAVEFSASHHATTVRRARPVAVRRAGAVADRHRREAGRSARSSYLIYDSVTPSAIPAHHEIATYATGGYAVTPAAVAGKKVLWIDTNGSDPRAAALDVEPGDATPAGAATWARQKLTAEPATDAIIYTMRSDWPAARAAVSALPAHMRSHVRWWIADPTGVPHVVPGASATQWYWGSSYDITTARASL